jgi:hypothetical protein
MGLGTDTRLGGVADLPAQLAHLIIREMGDIESSLLQLAPLKCGVLRKKLKGFKSLAVCSTV